MSVLPDDLTTKLLSFLTGNTFPCVAAKDAATKGHIKTMIAGHMACPNDDADILSFIYSFTEIFRKEEKGFHSAAIIFQQPVNITEELFEKFMWQRLRSLHEMDKQLYAHDSRVDADPSSPRYSFSLMGEAFFIIGMHPQSSRPARRFEYPVLIFNPHAQFEEMKKNMQFEKMKAIVRKRDIALAGSVNPMLTDFGEASEVFQYSGRAYGSNEECPFKKQPDKTIS